MISALKYYAVRIDNSVEFRASRLPIKAVRSSLTKTVKLPTNEFYMTPAGNYSVRDVMESKKVIIKQVVFKGGKILGTSYPALAATKSLEMVPLQPGKLYQLTRDQVKVLLDPKWQKEYLV